ncbi:hypothetical protein BCBMB205_22940 [Bacillus sp. CN2]|nr:hypothetical protein BCBMB205_22940 [Bacillus velezensis]ARZ58633.1 hypothetical protein BAGQ_2400 [Bacillus velezensis]GFR56088.1 hypothetical protein BCBMB205_22940 [Bacillus sp. CN2]
MLFVMKLNRQFTALDLSSPKCDFCLMGAARLQVNYALKTKSLTVTVVSGVILVSGFRLFI